MSRRLAYVAFALVTIGIGLLVNLSGLVPSPTARDVAGDALWAMMIAWWVGAIAPAASLRARSLAAYAVCAVVEVSQLWHAPAVDALRATRLGHLVLGSGFDPRDLAAYALGVAGAVVIELAHRPRASHS